jgi:hypothetical protein
MRRYNVLSQILLIHTVIAFALAAPVLVQEKRQACVDEVHVLEDMITVLRKRTLDEDLDMLWDGLWHYDNVWRNRNPAPQEMTESDDDTTPETSESGYSHSTHTSLENSDHESMELDGDAPQTTPESSTESEDWYTPPSSQESEDWYTPPSSPGSSTESDLDSDRWSTISNAPSAESQSKNLKAADSEMRGKAKVSRHISGTAGGVDTVNAARPRAVSTSA